MILLTSEEYSDKAKIIADSLNIRYTYNLESAEEVYLLLDEEGLSLTDGNLKMRGDFSDMSNRLKQSNLEKEMIVKAVRIKGADRRIKVVDATAGMGEDSLLLAAAGFNVTLYEYNPVIAALLSDCLDRAMKDPKLSEIVSRMKFFRGDSIEALNNMKESPDVVLLDPMFPERQKSGLIKKKFQLLQRLESPCSEETELFEAAVNARPKKIVVKRPAKGPYLAGVKPSHSFDGKAIRYDCYVYAN